MIKSLGYLLCCFLGACAIGALLFVILKMLWALTMIAVWAFRI